MRNIAFKSILLLVFISLTACGKKMAINIGGSSGPGVLRDQTNMNLCNSQAPRNASIMGETWILTQTAGALTQIQGLYVEDNQTTLTATCSIPNVAPQSATVKAPSTFDNTTLKHAAAPLKTVGSPRVLQCSSYLDSKPSSYTLLGSCLKIHLNGSDHYFVRASRMFLNF
jgi:hypothetical protein